MAQYLQYTSMMIRESERIRLSVTSRFHGIDSAGLPEGSFRWSTLINQLQSILYATKRANHLKADGRVLTHILLILVARRNSWTERTGILSRVIQTSVPWGSVSGVPTSAVD